MNQKILFLISLALIAFVNSGNKTAPQQPNLQRLIDNALQNNATELIIPEGKYIIDRPLQLNGVSNFRMKGEKKGSVIITSSMDVPLSDLKTLDESIGLYEYRNPILISPPWPKAFKGYAGWPEIYINGKPLSLCRFPNDDFIKADKILEEGRKPENQTESQKPPEFVSALLSDNYDKDLPLYLNGYWSFKWADEIIQVESINPQNGTVKLAAAHHYGMGAPSGGLFYAVNQPDYLDLENEFYFNAETGTIRFQHLFQFGEEQSITIAFRRFNLFEINDSENITMENITFNYHNGLVMEITDSRNVLIESCEMKGLGDSAVKIEGGEKCGIRNCTLQFIGNTGVFLTGGDRESLIKANHFVENSEIHNYARHVKTYAPAVKLEGVGHRVQGNKISQAPHNAILFSGNDHLIAENEIWEVCLNTSDAGAIYCGRDWTMGGNMIRDNLIRNLGQASHHHNWAIYLDDLASGISVLNNRIEGGPSGILIGGGRYNTINGNVIIDCPKASIMYDARGYDAWFRHNMTDHNLALWTNLDAMPINKEPWSSRFPWLQEIYSDDPACPKGVEMKNNRIINSHPPEINKKVRKFGEVVLEK